MPSATTCRRQSILRCDEDLVLGAHRDGVCGATSRRRCNREAASRFGVTRPNCYKAQATCSVGLRLPTETSGPKGGHKVSGEVSAFGRSQSRKTRETWPPFRAVVIRPCAAVPRGAGAQQGSRQPDCARPNHPELRSRRDSSECDGRYCARTLRHPHRWCVLPAASARSWRRSTPTGS